jgi:hypothetical protein
MPVDSGGDCGAFRDCHPFDFAQGRLARSSLLAMTNCGLLVIQVRTPGSEVLPLRLLATVLC